MKITVVNGNTRHGSTWHSKDLLLQELSKYAKTQVTEFTLPKDMPHFCKGCFSCFYNGEQTCPHVEYTMPIIKALEEADVIILTSPVYALDVSGQMKALLDHLCFMWFSHRPNPKLFNKVGVTMTTTAGAGLSHTAKTLKNSLKFWGVKRIFTFEKRASAMKWSDVSEKTLQSINKDTAEMAIKIAKTVKRIDKIPADLFRKMLFKAMRGMMNKNDWNERDRKHWESQDWLGAVKPF